MTIEEMFGDLYSIDIMAEKKTGEIVIAEEELQKMLDAAWDAGYNEGRAGTIPRLTPQPLPHTPTCTNPKSGSACNIPGFDPDTHGIGYPMSGIQ